MTEMEKARNQQVEKQQDAIVQQAARQNGERGLVPPVEIYEEDDALFLVADMPGVTKDTLHLEVGNKVLEVEGRITVNMDENVSPLFAEVRASRYVRRFTLGDDIDAGNAQATIKDGVLTIRLPKQDAHRRRKIEIQAA
ncbi:Hsp20/alpha crystallin family protein [Aquisalimonas asiatica]|uniref:Molecular chaperone IbpA, HSP20 family n=1 Tax=Aquisalimonas asiatica TaxID=406100 RepID=A0A1H8TBI6_9GAMM|nr:Hsp20/alpha crystallin family protein [Aquisalimonas asiatica]SEO87944.1 Molecular chaperone IbpA, HSP20 family [Aquisalimonas asiatica]